MGMTMMQTQVSKGNIYVKNTAEETAVSNDILKLPNGLLDLDKPFKLFDMKKFQQNVNREMKRQFPERNKLETQVRNTSRNTNRNTSRNTSRNMMCFSSSFQLYKGFLLITTQNPATEVTLERVLP